VSRVGAGGVSSRALCSSPAQMSADSACKEAASYCAMLEHHLIGTEAFGQQLTSAFGRPLAVLFALPQSQPSSSLGQGKAPLLGGFHVYGQGGRVAFAGIDALCPSPLFRFHRSGKPLQIAVAHKFRFETVRQLYPQPDLPASPNSRPQSQKLFWRPILMSLAALGRSCRA
jgi:hypothetical protein